VCFTYRVKARGKVWVCVHIPGKPVKSVKTALRKACEKAGLVYGKDVPGGVTFHTLRHTHGIERQLGRFFRGENL
jgi:integrase